jgi:uncharacterized protein (UPF0332 family)
MPRYSTELLAQAEYLTKREPKRPRQASLRRSISASYYALFHFLIEESTKLAVGTTHDQKDLRDFAGRAFVHSKMKSVCEDFKKTVPENKLLRPFWATLQTPLNPDLATVATHFVDLQKTRHAADYNLAKSFSRRDAESASAKAKDAMDAWGRLKNSTHATDAAKHRKLASLFALSLMLWPGLSGK